MPRSPDQQIVPDPAKRKTLKFMGAGLLMLLLPPWLTGCGSSSNQSRPSNERRSNPNNNPPSPENKKLQKEAQQVETHMLQLIEHYKQNPPPGFATIQKQIIPSPDQEGVPPNVSLEFSQAPELIDYLHNLHLQNKRDHVVAIIIALLDVGNPNNPRYHWSDGQLNPRYACNTYALDFVRLYLVSLQSPEKRNFAPDYIGDAFAKKPGIFGDIPGIALSLGESTLTAWGGGSYVQGFQKLMSSQEVELLHSNNLDWWMKTYGDRFGWQHVTKWGQLEQLLSQGRIAIAVTKQEKIPETPENIGHVLTLFSPDPQHPFIIARSQATRDIPFGIFKPPTDIPKEIRPSLGFTGNDQIGGMYNYWVFTGDPNITTFH